MLTSARPSAEKPAPEGRAALRAIHDVRLQIGRALVASGQDIALAGQTTDRWLLAALAAELLGLGGTGHTLNSASRGDFAPLNALQREVEIATGLQLSRTKAPLSAWSSDAATFPHLLDQPDPFGLLGQELRSRLLIGGPGALGMSKGAGRDQGGYYTPFRLAHRLAQQALAEYEPESDAVPNVIDPACGAGTFLSASFDILYKQLDLTRREHTDRRFEPVAWTVSALHGVEKDPVALTAARLAIAVRASKAEKALKGAGQLALFGQTATYGPQIMDRIRLGDSLQRAPAETLSGTDRLQLRIVARDEPGRSIPTESAVVWDRDFPLRFSDEEGTYSSRSGFDLVLTNPPFVPVDRIPTEERDRLKSGLSTMQRRFDLFIGFVERARTLLSPGGRATLLIPRTFLTEANAEKCRRLLLETSLLHRIEELGPIKFEGAKLDCIALTFIARRPTETTAVEIRRHETKKVTAILQSAFRRTPRAMFRTELADPAAEEGLRIAARTVPLGRYFCASWGARGSPVKDFHLSSPSHPLAKPMIKGDDIEPFVVRPSSRWLLYDLERLYRPARRELFETDKLVVRKVSGARGLICAVDTGRHYTDDSLACVARKADLVSIPIADRRRHKIRIGPMQAETSKRYDLDFLAALLQTGTVQTYYRVHLGGGLNVFPELIEALPIPKPAELSSPEVDGLAQLGRAARQGQPFDALAADLLARRLFKLA